MGREVRRVPPKWDHPTIERYGRVDRQPMYDRLFSDAEKEWLFDFDRIRAGGADAIERECYPNGVCEWANDVAPPDPAYYRPWADEDATWFQLWETVSEGTPVSPPFETQEELIEYLAENGDFWDQKRCTQSNWTTLYGGVFGVSGWGHERAKRFVMGPGWAPSIVMAGGKTMSGVEFVTEE